MKKIKNKKSISKSKQNKSYINSFLLNLIHYNQSHKINKFIKNTKKKKFKPSINKNLHNNSNITPSTTQPSLQHQNYN